jgi:serine/threonine-protein kinase
MRKLIVVMVLMLCSAARADSHGSIAFSPSTGASGAAWSYCDDPSANAAAISACNQSDCQWVVEFHNTCAAVAANGKHDYGWAWNSDRGAAEQNALNQCGTHGASCQIVESVCSNY